MPGACFSDDANLMDVVECEREPSHPVWRSRNETLYRSEKPIGLRLRIDSICPVHFGACGQERRELVVALYPFIPAKAELYWRLQGDFEQRYPDVRLRFVDAPEYYSGQLEELLAKGQVDVAEVDTVFLHDFKSKNLITPFAGATLGEFLGVARSAATIDGAVWGIPHWVCGNFLFFRKDDPENGPFVKATTLDALERIIGRSADYRQGLLTDLKGSSSLGEKYLDAVVDRYQTPEKALQHAHPDTIEQTAVTSLARLLQIAQGSIRERQRIRADPSA